jgi:hypothetical protein
MVGSIFVNNGNFLPLNFPDFTFSPGDSFLKTITFDLNADVLNQFIDMESGGDVLQFFASVPTYVTKHVPEPSTFTLLALSVAGLWVSKRRKVFR